MNYTKNTGWYYINGNNKSPSWSGVEFLYNFLTKNKSVGPYGKEEVIENLQIGDILQISFDGKIFSHTLIIVEINNKNSLSGIKIASHTFDSFGKAVTEYEFQKIRMLHIEGARTY